MSRVVGDGGSDRGEKDCEGKPQDMRVQAGRQTGCRIGRNQSRPGNGRRHTHIDTEASPIARKCPHDQRHSDLRLYLRREIRETSRSSRSYGGWNGELDTSELEPVEQARQRYAAELRFTAKVRSSAVVDAFATVPREQFVGPGPWRIKSPMDIVEYWTTDDDSPSHVYHDVLIALDESRGINNGQPSLWAYLFDHLDLIPGEQVLHLGCGTGYYTAIIAELVGSAGRVTAVEIDATLAQKAKSRSPISPRSK